MPRSSGPLSDLARSASPTTCHSWASLNCMSTRHISWAWEEGRTVATSALLRSPYELNLIGTPATVFASVQPTEANRGLKGSFSQFEGRRHRHIPTLLLLGYLVGRGRGRLREVEAILVGLRAMRARGVRRRRRRRCMTATNHRAALAAVRARPVAKGKK